MTIDHEAAVKARADHVRMRGEYLRMLRDEPDNLVGAAMVLHEVNKAQVRFAVALELDPSQLDEDNLAGGAVAKERMRA